jgi:hypothetical protein
LVGGGGWHDVVVRDCVPLELDRPADAPTAAAPEDDGGGGGRGRAMVTSIGRDDDGAAVASMTAAAMRVRNASHGSVVDDDWGSMGGSGTVVVAASSFRSFVRCLRRSLAFWYVRCCCCRCCCCGFAIASVASSDGIERDMRLPTAEDVGIVGGGGCCCRCCRRRRCCVANGNGNGSGEDGEISSPRDDNDDAPPPPPPRLANIGGSWTMERAEKCNPPPPPPLECSTPAPPADPDGEGHCRCGCRRSDDVAIVVGGGMGGGGTPVDPAMPRVDPSRRDGDDDVDLVRFRPPAPSPCDGGRRTTSTSPRPTASDGRMHDVAAAADADDDVVASYPRQLDASPNRASRLALKASSSMAAFDDSST